MGERFELFLDWSAGGNVEHMATHEVTPEEVEQVLRRGFTRRRQNRGAAEWIVAHYTNVGRFLAVPFDMEWVDDLDSWLVTPYTAYDPQQEP